METGYGTTRRSGEQATGACPQTLEEVVREGAQRLLAAALGMVVSRTTGLSVTAVVVNVAGALLILAVLR